MFDQFVIGDTLYVAWLARLAIRKTYLDKVEHISAK